MPKLHFDPQFEVAYKKYIKGNSRNINKASKALRIFSENPNHPSLNLEKLANTQIWSIRVSQGDRIFFIWQNKSTANLFWIGKHDSYRKF